MSDILFDVLKERVKAGIEERLYQCLFFSKKDRHTSDEIKKIKCAAKDINMLCKLIEKNMEIQANDMHYALSNAENIIEECCEKIAKKENSRITIIVNEILVNKAKSYLETLKTNSKLYEEALQSASYLAFVVSVNLGFFIRMFNEEKVSIDVIQRFCLFDVSLIELLCIFLCNLMKEMQEK